MKIDIRSNLQSVGTATEFSAKEMLTDGIFEDIKALTEADVVCTVVYDGQTVNVKGTLDIEIELACDRCLTEYGYRMSLPFDEKFSSTQSDDEEEIYQYTGYMLPLDKMLHDLIILNYPTKCLCRDDCEGIR